MASHHSSTLILVRIWEFTIKLDLISFLVPMDLLRRGQYRTVTQCTVLPHLRVDMPVSQPNHRALTSKYQVLNLAKVNKDRVGHKVRKMQRTQLCQFRVNKIRSLKAREHLPRVSTLRWLLITMCMLLTRMDILLMVIRVKLLITILLMANLHMDNKARLPMDKHRKARLPMDRLRQLPANKILKVHLVNSLRKVIPVRLKHFKDNKARLIKVTHHRFIHPKALQVMGLLHQVTLLMDHLLKDFLITHHNLLTRDHLAQVCTHLRGLCMDFQEHILS